MDDKQRLVLQEMITKNDVQDNTEKIRELKHSALIRKDIAKICNIKRVNKSKDFRTLDKECLPQCGFLFRYYPNIYNKMLKEEINIQIFYKFLDALKSIEDGLRDQHEASYEIGMLLRQIYVEKKIDMSKEPGARKQMKKGPAPKKITYAEFKKQQEELKNTE